MTFQETLTAAVADISANGYSSELQLVEWMGKIRRAAKAELLSDNQVRELTRRFLESLYTRDVLRGGLSETNPSVGRFTVQRLLPQMRAELDRRVAANVSLIKLNQDEAVETTLRRLSGWATSIPKGGSLTVDKRDVKSHISKPTRQSRYEARRCQIDQGHKFVAALSEIVAEGSGAIAGVWRSHWRRPGYDYREDHKARDKQIFAVRGNWAIRAGLMRKGAGYTDEITKPAEEPFCSCYYRWITELSELPDDMLTAKGRKWLSRDKAA